jgi:hypothetical protein
VRLLPHIDWFPPFTRDVLVGFIRSGHAALAAEVLPDAPFNLASRSDDDWEIVEIGALTLLLGEKAVVRAVLRLGGRTKRNRERIASDTVCLLRGAGRGGVAFAFAALEGVTGVEACDYTGGDAVEACELSTALGSIAETIAGKGKAGVVRGPVTATKPAAPRYRVKLRQVVIGGVVAILVGFLMKWVLR